jgi:hypothetical protein
VKVTEPPFLPISPIFIILVAPARLLRRGREVCILYTYFTYNLLIFDSPSSLSQLPHLTMGLSTGMDKPTTRQAFCKSPSKPRPVDHCTRVKYSLPPTAFSARYADGIPSSCAPSKGATHFILSGANSSAPGFVLLMTLTSSKMPALIILMPLMPPDESPCRKSVVPQSGQKWSEKGRVISLDTCGGPPVNLLVISLPLSAILLICLGVPDRTLKLSLGTTMLFE